MMKDINVLLISGGGGNEHHISITSCAFIRNILNDAKGINPIQIHIDENTNWRHEAGMACEINQLGELLIFSDEERSSLDQVVNIDYVIPYMHGYPGESGDIQPLLKLSHLPFFASDPEGHKNCFNKVTTKLWLEKAGIPTAPFEIYQHGFNKEVIEDFFDQYKAAFVKASSEGSSFGCYPVAEKERLWSSITDALKYSTTVLIEPLLKAREIEVSVFEYQGNICISKPGEILTQNQGFYSYEEKYSEESSTTTSVEAELTDKQKEKIISYAEKAFKLFDLKDMARIDFFLTETGEILLNELNTLPGLTPISMFPKMMENSGVKFKDYILDRIRSSKK